MTAKEMLDAAHERDYSIVQGHIQDSMYYGAKNLSIRADDYHIPLPPRIIDRLRQDGFTVTTEEVFVPRRRYLLRPDYPAYTYTKVTIWWEF